MIRAQAPTHLGLALCLSVLGCRSVEADEGTDQAIGGDEPSMTDTQASSMSSMDEGMAGGGATQPAAATAALSCSSSVPDEISCGSSVCPIPNDYQIQFCIMPCCTEADTCGIHGTVSGQSPTDCMEEQEGEGDQRCPNDLFADGSEGEGCCTDTGDCGLIDPVFGLGCVERSTVLGVTLEPLRCDR